MFLQLVHIKTGLQLLANWVAARPWTKHPKPLYSRGPSCRPRASHARAALAFPGPWLILQYPRI